MDNADSTRSRYSYRGEPFAAVSAEATVPGWDLASILSGRRLRTRRRYAQVTSRELIAAGFTLLPTFSLPHYSIVLGTYTENEAERLLVVLGPTTTTLTTSGGPDGDTPSVRVAIRLTSTRSTKPATSGRSSTGPPNRTESDPGSLIVAGDEDEPFLARVVDIVDTHVGRQIVHLDVVGVPEEAIDELRHARLIA